MYLQSTYYAVFFFAVIFIFKKYSCYDKAFIVLIISFFSFLMKSWYHISHHIMSKSNEYNISSLLQKKFFSCHFNAKFYYDKASFDYKYSAKRVYLFIYCSNFAKVQQQNKKHRNFGILGDKKNVESIKQRIF